MSLLLYCQSWGQSYDILWRAWSGGVVLAIGDSVEFFVMVIISKVYVELVLIVLG